jgi:hypothetical protein
MRMVFIMLLIGTFMMVLSQYMEVRMKIIFVSRLRCWVMLLLEEER